MLSEADIIKTLHDSFPVAGGIGDDAAILPFSDTHSYVVTKDLLVEDVHFRRSYGDAASLAHKSLHVNLSDIAAMGAKPSFVFLGLSVPKGLDDYAADFLKAFTAACKKHDVVLMGGDTTASPDKIFISVTAIGIALTKSIKRRSTAQVGDVVCVAGNLGYAHVGFLALEKAAAGLEGFKESFLKPSARMAEGLWFGAQAGVTAMMDISDGLYIDFSKLCAASSVAGVLNRLAVSADMQTACESIVCDPRQALYSGGEDYGLLVTIKGDAFESVAAAFEKEFGYGLQLVGVVAPGRAGLVTVPADITVKPFSHFGEGA